MPRDRSLEEFLGGSASDEDESETSSDTGSEASDAPSDASDAGRAAPEAATPGPKPDADDPEPEPDADDPGEAEAGREVVGAGSSGDADAGVDTGETEAEPFAPTYRWSADGGACSNCGDPARARWHGDGGFVCRRCKDW